MDTEAVSRLDTLGEVSAKRELGGRILWRDETSIKKKKNGLGESLDFNARDVVIELHFTLRCVYVKYACAFWPSENISVYSKYFAPDRWLYVLNMSHRSTSALLQGQLFILLYWCFTSCWWPDYLSVSNSAWVGWIASQKVFVLHRFLPGWRVAVGGAWLCVKMPLAMYVGKGRSPSSRALSQNPKRLFWALNRRRGPPFWWPPFFVSHSYSLSWLKSIQVFK